MSIYKGQKETISLCFVCVLLLTIGMTHSVAGEITLRDKLTFLNEGFEGNDMVLRHDSTSSVTKNVLHELSRDVFHGGKQAEHLKVEYEDCQTCNHDYWNLSSLKEVRVGPGCMLELSLWAKANRPFNINIGFNGGVIYGATYDGNVEWKEIVIRNLYEKIYSQASGQASASGSELHPDAKLFLTNIWVNGVIHQGVPEKLATPLDIYIDDVRLYSLIPIEIEKMKKSREKLSQKLTTEEGKKYREEFEKTYTDLDKIEKTVKQDITQDELTLVQTDFKDLLERYTALVKNLVFLK